MGPLSASEARNTQLVKAIKKVRPAIVNIQGRKTVRADANSLAGESLKQVNGMGTGIVIDSRGYIITNFHVVDGVSNIQVALHDERTTTARVVAHDPKTDLAIIKIELGEALPVMDFGTSCDLMPGEPVAAIGNAYGYDHTVTQGIISALHRTVQVSDDQKYHDLIQTDASINPGNSGGPLLNADGVTIGINVAVRVGAQGIGFAIPIDEALDVAARLISVERLEQQTHGVLAKTRCEPERRQLVVGGVRSASPGEKAGLLAGDVITQIDNRRIERALDLELAFLGRKRDENLRVEYLRGGAQQTSQLALSPLAKGPVRTQLADRVWDTFGMRLQTMEEGEFRDLNARYRGGLRITAVRSSSPAAQQGIRQGDVLVGMHIWETVSVENIAYILEREDLTRLDPMLFYIVRGNDTLFGHLRLADRGK